MKRSLLLLTLCTLGISQSQAGTSSLQYQQQTLDVQGQQVSVQIADGLTLQRLPVSLDGPRMLTFNSNGDLLIGSRSGKIYRLPPPYTEAEVLVTLPGYPHSVAVRGDEIFIARTNAVLRAPYKPGQKRLKRSDFEVMTELPGGSGHNSRTIAVGPDKRLYVSLGITGNCSDEYLDDSYSFDDRRGGLFVIDESGSRARLAPYASGLRNPVGFDWQPGSTDLYASNNGPDHWGYENPPEYFSRLTANSFHGMPWYQFDGKKIRRDDCISRKPPLDISQVPEPAATFPARNAPMGVSFIPDNRFGKGLNGDAVVALHGSWATTNGGSWRGDPASRRPPKLVLVRFSEGKAQRVDDLVSGFQLNNGQRWARPAGVAAGPDGAVYFTSDSPNPGLYRLSPK